MIVRFCPQCGEATVPKAKFCVGCGEPLSPDVAPVAGNRIFASRTFLVVLAIIVVAGLATTALIFRSKPETQVASVAPADSADSGDTGSAPAKLPPGHPKVELPAEARQFVDEVQQEADKKPNDLAAWNKLGNVAFRASLFDDSYSKRAMDAFVHVLKIDPDNLDALRGVGNLHYDHRKFDEAIAAYEHYLKKKSDDQEVRADLGTMYLYTGNADQAIVQYKKAIAIKPDFFEGYFNLAVAYDHQNDPKQARAALDDALKYAPDEKSKARANQLLAQLGSGGSLAQAKAQSAPAPAANFHQQVEQVVRGIPFAGPKVKSVEWPSAEKARVMMDQFPMDQMPPVARAKFEEDLKDGISAARKRFNVKNELSIDMVDGDSGRVMATISG